MAGEATMRPGSSAATLGALLLLGILRPAACVDAGTVTGTGLEPEQLQAVLQDVWPEVMEPALVDAVVSLEALTDATEAWALAEQTGEDPVGARDEARVAFVDAMSAWQRVEVLQVGPAASSLDAVGGLDLRDEVYSWPTTSACLVDQMVVPRAFEAPDFFEAGRVNVRGLDALETLLFSSDESNACPPQVEINATGEFDALGPDGVRHARADYAAVIAHKALDEAEQLLQLWSPDAGDFAGALATAGDAGSPYTSADSGLNAVFDALFYLETQTKDAKLGAPLGLVDCGYGSCAELTETPMAGLSNRWVAENLVGFRALFTGGSGQGLDDLLVALGHQELSDAMLDALDRADEAAAALDIPITDAAVAQSPEALELHAALAEVSGLMKTDIATLLFLRVPDEAAGDND